ncbi:RNA-binding S4 domain-containing protein [Myceligenerans xiligouense]|uniref:RNA-binding S4 domain-containing protein n=1 Tax=Myceligenerans xiligouense TaxID=253184 RepID=UPI001FE4884E|nr:RNA-binding S4 domain-containing protein [Myceligenerans xiligouense]
MKIRDPQPGALPEPEPVPIRDESIRLGQFLKLANLADDGVRARELVTAGDVLVNGRTETRRGRQLTRGDRVTVRGPGGAQSAVVG